ncbi:hypothetical protein [Lachnoclostridium phytofermentans]|uniref:hypothetical protein n=1 Tax=Lachnoclostridium phytofermentans TaxID=66219 RepID=UPI000495128A|nr:hypothetical protein [Lachnoclostridium phytofermentans]
MKDITDFFEEQKVMYIERAEHCTEQIEMFERGYKNNEQAHGDIAGYPNAIIPDEHGREQFISARVKREGLLAKVELIEQLQELYGFVR